MPLTIYMGNKNYSSWSMRGWLALEQTGEPVERWRTAAAAESTVNPAYDL